MVPALKSNARRLLKWAGLDRSKIRTMGAFSLSLVEAQERRTGTPLEDIFYSTTGRLVHKWVDYLPVYDRFFGHYRGSDVRMLEIGVSMGGSLDMWRRYFGPNAMIFGIDIDPECADRVDPPNQVRIGSQADPKFLNRVIAEMGAPDIVLDDGSHVASHQLASFRALWPHVKDGGFYVIEDTHTAYWKNFEGGLHKKGTAVDLAKTLIDDMNSWFHEKPEDLAPKDEIGAVCAFESIVVIEKRKKLRPGHIKIGTGA